MEIQMRPRAQSWIRDMWCHYGVGGGVLGGGGKELGGVFGGRVCGCLAEWGLVGTGWVGQSLIGR